MKKLDLNQTVAQLVAEYPELKEVLAEIGFKEILQPMTLKLMGSVMTIPRGARVKGIALDDVVARLEAHGFSVKQDAAQARQEELRSMISRLSAGEPLAAIRQEFVEKFASVSVQEIADAEQNLIKSGTPVHEVQKLCDVHSALFHGRTENEVLADEMKQQADRQETSADALPEGHPLRILLQENAQLEQLLDALAAGLETDIVGEKLLADLKRLQGLYAHYGKKEELLMPVLYRYGVTGPGQVMWGVDDEIKKELSVLLRSLGEDAEAYPIYRGRLEQLLQRTREMIYKEEKILFPLCLRYFTQEEWYQAYRDFPEMGYAFLTKIPKWDAGEQWTAAAEQQAEGILSDGRVQLPTGELSVKQLQGILSLLPIDVTFIDEKDILRFFLNEGHVFARPKSALGRLVFDCHPPQIVPMVRQMLADFKAKKKDHMEIWSCIKGKPVSVRYVAVYDAAGAYIGTAEFVQSYEEALQRFAKQTA